MTLEEGLLDERVRARWAAKLRHQANGCIVYLGSRLHVHSDLPAAQPRRVAWFYEHGAVIQDKDLLLLCTCRNEDCVNPAHLVLGTPENRFWSQVNKEGPVAREGLGPCWLWTGRRTVKGHAWEYGKINFPTDDGPRYGGSRNRRKRIEMPAHRFSWELHHGKIGDPKLFVCHRCDVPLCVRPDHLFLGTAKANSEDAVEKGRTARGAALSAAIARGRIGSPHYGSKTHCKGGHELAGDNLYIDPHGHRVCRACARESQRRHVERKRSAHA